jgi:hypothetical protein
MASSKLDVSLKLKAEKSVIGGKVPQKGNIASGNLDNKSMLGGNIKIAETFRKSVLEIGKKFSDVGNKISQSNQTLKKGIDDLKNAVNNLKTKIGSSSIGQGASGLYNSAKAGAGMIASSLPFIGAGIGLGIMKTMQMASNYREQVSGQASTIGMTGLIRRPKSNAFNNAEYGEFLKSARVSSGQYDLLQDANAQQLKRIEQYKLKFGVSGSELGSLVGVAGGVSGFEQLLTGANKVTAGGSQTQEFLNEMKSILESAVKEGMNSSEVAKIGDDFNYTVAKINLGNKNMTMDLALKLGKSLKDIRSKVNTGDISDPVGWRYAKTAQDMLKNADQSTIDYLNSQGVFGDLNNVAPNTDLTKMFNPETISSMIKMLQTGRGGELDKRVMQDFYNASMNSSGKADFGRFDTLMESFFPGRTTNESLALFKSFGMDDREVKSRLEEKSKEGLAKEVGNQSGVNELLRINKITNDENSRKLNNLSSEALNQATKLNESLNKLIDTLSGGASGEGLTKIIDSLGTGMQKLIEGFSELVGYANSLSNSIKKFLPFTSNKEINVAGE